MAYLLWSTILAPYQINNRKPLLAVKWDQISQQSF